MKLLNQARQIGGRGRPGMTLVEIMIGSLFMALVLTSFLWMNIASNRQAMDAYYELLATQLAQEPIEIFSAFGYRWLEKYRANPHPDYPLEAGVIVDPAKTVPPLMRPGNATKFRRMIELTPVTKGSFKAIRVDVTVSPADESQVKTWLTRDYIKSSALIVEDPL